MIKLSASIFILVSLCKLNVQVMCEVIKSSEETQTSAFQYGFSSAPTLSPSCQVKIPTIYYILKIFNPAFI